MDTSYNHDVFIKALQAELSELNALKSETMLFSGRSTGKRGSFYYYRFELPVQLYLYGLQTLTCSFGERDPASITGSVVAIENQYLTVAFTQSLGDAIPEMHIRWKFDGVFTPVLTLLETAKNKPTCAPLLYNAVDREKLNGDENCSIDVSGLSAECGDIVQKIAKNRLSIVWGAAHSGKSSLIGQLAAMLVISGKKVLLASAAADGLDCVLRHATSQAQKTGVDAGFSFLRLGYPGYALSAEDPKISLEQRIADFSAAPDFPHKKELALLNTYISGRLLESINEEYYSNLNDLRQKLREKDAQIAQAAAELPALEAAVATIEKASVFERMKKGFGKEDLQLAQKKLADKVAAHKRLQALQQGLSTEILKQESRAPLRGRERTEFLEASEEIKRLGGKEQLQQAIDADLNAKRITAMQSASLVAGTAAALLADANVQNVGFDVVLIDDADSIDLARVTALAAMAKEKIVIAGDPYQIEPVAFSKSELSQRWLQRDVFEYLAQPKEIGQFFSWSDANPRWVIPLTSSKQSATKAARFETTNLFGGNLRYNLPAQNNGKIQFIDTTDLRSQAKQYIGRKKILPYNEIQARKTLDVVKHALLQPGMSPVDIGIVVPFEGPALFITQLLHTAGIENVEIGIPQFFHGRRKRVIIFDTVAAGMDYTMKGIDDKKIGREAIVRLLHTIIACVEEELYVLADMSHLKNIYRGRAFVEFMQALQPMTDAMPVFPQSVKKFDELDWDRRKKLNDPTVRPSASGASTAQKPPEKIDHEMQIHMKAIAKQEASKPQTAPRNYEQEILLAVLRVLGMQTDVNMLSLYIGGNLLFRKTPGTETSAMKLPGLTCKSEREFSEIMEQWNLLIYDMSGGNRTDLSFFARHAPETRVRWDINSLKIYYSSAMEAVIEEGKHQIAVSVARVFQECVGKAQPANPVEWSMAYLNFLSKMELYLGWIGEQIRK
jgi:hypothetical protein